MKVSRPDAQKLASFIPVPGSAVNAEMWPVHTLLWLQPDVKPLRPRSSALRIERRHKTPAPDFLPARAAPADAPHSREHACEPLARPLARFIPDSACTPLGWDPRALKGGRE